MSQIKQLEERNVANEIEMLLWSDRMDLVAFSNVKGEVALHRLTWARAWSLSPNKEGNSIKGLAWRPDGKVLAIAYSSGEIILINVENKNTLHTIHLEDMISCLLWVEEKVENKEAPNLLADLEQQNDYIKYLDYSSTYLPDLPSRSTYDSTSSPLDEDIYTSLLQNQTELNLLLVGTAGGVLYISIFGLFPCVLLNLSDYLGYNCSIINMHLSNNLDLLFITVKDNENVLKVVSLNIEIFKTHKKELFAIAMKYGHIINLINYLSHTIVTIKETWETILLEMDSKLSKYASKVPEGTLTADFLDLLLFGITSDEMQEFLLHDLTEKGLKKFGENIEMCYANIQKLLLKHVTKAGQNITFHLAELRGMSRLEHRYKVVGLSEDLITKSIADNGAFLIKVGEMQQIINHSMLNYKAFFRWLYTAIKHLLDEQIPSELPKMTQQDVSHISEFLQNFDNFGPDEGSIKKGFSMERLGQYLTDDYLVMPINASGNIWSDFLEQNECVQNHSSIMRHNKEMSLLQQFKVLKESLDEIFVKPKLMITDQIKLNKIIDLLAVNDLNFKITQNNFNNESIFVALVDAKLAEGLFFIEIFTRDDKKPFKAGYFYFPQLSNSELNYHLIDLKFYSNNILTVLLRENSINRIGTLLQFPAAQAKDRLQEVDYNTKISRQNLIKLNSFDFSVVTTKVIDGIVPLQIAVSGSRRVGIVLSENRRKVRLFEMEAEEDDEEDADMSNSMAKECDTSMV